MPRTIWKGAISFGMVHIPIALHPASREHALDFDWLDRRDMARVGYKRINKRTGKAIDSADVVKGYEHEPDHYVLVTDEDFKQANPEATQTVEILGFVDASEVGPEYFVRPYYLEAMRRGEKGYALLREVLRESARVAIASVVIHTKQHLATLRVEGDWLLLITMRFADEVLPAEGMAAVDGSLAKRGVGARELEMARKLVDEMTVPWEPAQYRDTYRDDLLARIEARVKSGETHELSESAPEDGAAAKSSNVIDLMEALRSSLGRKGGGTSKGADEDVVPAEKPGAKPTVSRKAATSHQNEGAAAKRRTTPAKKAATKAKPAAPKQAKPAARRRA